MIEKFISDNKPYYTLNDYIDFCKENNIAYDYKYLKRNFKKIMRSYGYGLKIIRLNKKTSRVYVKGYKEINNEYKFIKVNKKIYYGFMEYLRIKNIKIDEFLLGFQYNEDMQKETFEEFTTVLKPENRVDISKIFEE